MLKAHMNAIEDQLLATSKIPANSGHPLHKGTPRESFIKQYLQSHLSDNVAIGTGEIIDASSSPGAARNQFDIVVYKRNYPKLDFGGGVSGFLVESVIATIEVKSILDQVAINQSVQAAHTLKQLVPNVRRAMSSGWIPPKVLSYVVGYTGPSNMATVYGHILQSHKSFRIPLPSWTAATKTQTPGTSLDGVFLLKTGFVKLDNTPLNLNPTNRPGIFTVCDSKDNNILMLFLSLQNAFDNMEAAWLNPSPYIRNVGFSKVVTI